MGSERFEWYETAGGGKKEGKEEAQFANFRLKWCKVRVRVRIRVRVGGRVRMRVRVRVRVKVRVRVRVRVKVEVRVRVTVDPSLPMGQRGLRWWGKWGKDSTVSPPVGNDGGVRTRVGEEAIRVKSFADRRDEGAGPASPSSAGGSWREMADASSRSER